MKKHVFDIEVAQIVGVNAAILLENIAYWVEHSKANCTNFHDGRYWTFNSMKAFEELFPYIKPRGIRTALDKLKDAGLVIVGNYNKSPYDRTQWYALTEKAEALLGLDTSICQKRQMKTSDTTNENVTNDKPIPNINTVVNTSINTDEGAKPKRQRFVPPTLEEVEAYCKERGNAVDPRKFLDYYEMTGWRTKGGATIKDWRACVRTWERNTQGTPTRRSRPTQAQPLTDEERRIKEENAKAFDVWASMGLTD